ncbi:MAG: phage tail tape measure protein [Treponema sp.]|nr:phage tail tape measure protein [Treponema sp.]
MAELTEELRVLVTAEVDKAIKNLKNVDKQTADTEKLFKSLGTSITSALSVKAIVDFRNEAVAAYKQQKEAISVLETVLKSTGATAWTSSGQLQEMASSLQKITNYGDETILSMQGVLLGFKNIKGEQFESATKAILDMATVMKMDLKSAAQVVGKALDDPAHGLDSLRRQGFAFTDAQKAMIQSMLDVGDVAGAQKIILDELESTYGGAAEAAADLDTQIKNSLGDLLEGYGKLFTELGKGSGALETFRDSVDWLSDALWNFDEYFAKAAGGKKYTEWFESLANTKKLDEAQKQLTAAREKYQEAVEKGKRKEIDSQITVVDYWQKQVRLLTEAVSQEQKLQAEENARRDAENEINELMFSIAQNYGKLSKDDPVIQLENYKKQLADIEKQREKLSGSATGIDTKDALTQLDYIEKKIREKIAKLQADGKKSWQKWFSEITKIDENDFTSGADAAKLYLEQMEREFQTAKSVSEMLGVKFDLNSALKKQQDEIKSTLESLFNIDPSKINEAFTSQDASVQALIDKYKELSEATAPKTWEEQMSEAVENIITKLTDLDAQTAKVFGNMAVQMSNISLDAAMTGFEEFGRALGEGKDAADSMQAALAAMAQQILNQLPMMFLQAGLQLIAQGQWPLGLGLIAAAGSSAIMAGYVDGKTSSKSEANALGGVYGADDYAAFAKGGTFTNAIVQSPTFFRFAKGSGFGTGLMGEAGPEAIMPLTRGVDGSLGVNASGLGANVEVKIPVTVYSDEPVEVNDTTDESGQRKIEIMVGSMINKHLSDGSADRALKSRYGLKVQGV